MPVPQMRFLNWFSKIASKLRARRTPTELPQQELFRLLHQNADDPVLLLNLSRTHHDLILRHFPTWQHLPPDIRCDPAKSQPYIHFLVTLATLFAEKLDDPILLQLLEPRPDSIITLWPTRLKQARALADQHRYPDAIDLLTNLLIDTRDLAGPGAQHHLALTHGLFAHCLFDSGQVADSEPHYHTALRLCRDANDADGIKIYLHALYETYRYLDSAALAADCADQFAEFVAPTDPPLAHRYRTYAHLAREGEPLLRIVVHHESREYELDQVPALINAKLKFVFRRNRPTLALTQHLTRAGSRLAEASQFEPALEKFTQATQVDPHDPDPVYQSALTLVLLKRYEEAIAKYELTERLAPGWYNCRCERFLARLLALGRLDHQNFLTLRLLESPHISPQDKLPLAQRLIAEIPDLAAAHLAHARVLLESDHRPDALNSAHLGLNIDPDSRSRLFLQLAMLTDDPKITAQALKSASTCENANLLASAIATIAARSRPASSMSPAPDSRYTEQTEAS